MIKSAKLIYVKALAIVAFMREAETEIEWLDTQI